MGRPGTKARSGDAGFRMGTGVFALALVLIVAAIGFELSLLSIQKFGLNFWRTSTWDPVAGQFGALPFIWGTLYSSILALLISTPVALGIAIFISELCPGWLRQPLVFLTELLAAIPSIVYGLWGIFVLVPAVRSLETSTPGWLRQTPFFSGPPLGVGMLAAGLILAIMVIPFTSSVAREVLKSVPLTQREGAYALGATRFEAIRTALFFARTGIIGSIMLGFGRALGETMAVTMVIGNNPQVTASLFAPQYTMAAVIANEFTEAADELYLSALIEIGLVLFIVTLVVNGLSRLLIWSMARPGKARVFASTVPAEGSVA
jgi:phosphate transport system permease protein